MDIIAFIPFITVHPRSSPSQKDAWCFGAICSSASASSLAFFATGMNGDERGCKGMKDSSESFATDVQTRPQRGCKGGGFTYHWVFEASLLF
jgi:hypothetical protein